MPEPADPGPAHRIEGPAWLVTRHEDVKRLLADPRLSLDKRNALPGSYQGLALPPALDANLLNMDPPDHTRIRRLVSKAFTAGRVERLRDPVRRIAGQLLDVVAAKGRADLVADYAAPLPIIVISDLLGIPDSDRIDFRRWTDALLGPDTALAKESMAAMLGFFTKLIADKRAHPADDLLSDMIAARDEDDQLTEDELTSLVFLILFAGYENTVHLIGNAVLALLDHPDQLQALRSDPALIPAAVEELIRYGAPAPLSIRRFPLEDIIVGPVTIPAGETVLLSIASANHDPALLPDPDTLDVTRAAQHLSFGHGVHYCLGATLARLETAIALDALLTRFPRLSLDVPCSEVRWRPSSRTHGLVALPVIF